MRALGVDIFLRHFLITFLLFLLSLVAYAFRVYINVQLFNAVEWGGPCSKPAPKSSLSWEHAPESPPFLGLWS
jgi:hypothetical protein